MPKASLLWRYERFKWLCRWVFRFKHPQFPAKRGNKLIKVSTMIALFISFEFKVIREVTLHRIHVTVPSFPSTPKSPQQGWNFANTITETFEMMSRNSQTLTIVASPTLVQLSKVRWTLEIRDVSIFMFFFPFNRCLFFTTCVYNNPKFSFSVRRYVSVCVGVPRGAVDSVVWGQNSVPVRGRLEVFWGTG